MSGGYDDGYAKCSCFWGCEPGSQVRTLVEHLPSIEGLRVLDLGCGEGKNAMYLARLGARVTATDISEQALRNARTIWPATDYAKVTWANHDATKYDFGEGPFDLVIMYGLLHCLKRKEDVEALVMRTQANTVHGGYNILCAFNDRKQDLTAHPGFSPLLLCHEFYTHMYSSWEMLAVSDEDLFETHPHNNIPHSHSLTRAIARRLD